MLTLRLATPDEDWEALTALLHRAYADLAAGGLRFYASHQSANVTRERAEQGECWLAEQDGMIVGTITLVPPDRAKGSPWYDRPDVAKFNQLAIEPRLRGSGLGRRLVAHAEDRARALGAAELALDTSEEATGLIALYTHLGYRFIEHVDWRPDVNYRSMLFSKAL